MPIYEYECNACGRQHEFIQKFSDGPKRKCPSCGALRLRKLISAAAFHLKGDGWYVTDFRDKDKKKKGNGKEEGKDAKPDSGAESKSADKSSGTEAAKTKSGGAASDS